MSRYANSYLLGAASSVALIVAGVLVTTVMVFQTGFAGLPGIGLIGGEGAGGLAGARGAPPSGSALAGRAITPGATEGGDGPGRERPAGAGGPAPVRNAIPGHAIDRLDVGRGEPVGSPRGVGPRGAPKAPKPPPATPAAPTETRGGGGEAVGHRPPSAEDEVATESAAHGRQGVPPGLAKKSAGEVGAEEGSPPGHPGNGFGPPGHAKAHGHSG